MVPGSGAGAAVRHEVWEELASAKSNALAAWRFEPCSTLSENNTDNFLADAWIAKASQRDMESLTLALQRELCSRNSNDNNLYSSSGWTTGGGGSTEWKCKAESDVSSGSDSLVYGPGGCAVESPPRKGDRQHQQEANNNGIPKNNALAATGKVSKRRSRAANKSPITFLNADPANFRAMVQQVTGVPLNPNATRLWSPATGAISMPVLLKPEPKRPSSACAASFQGLPTLDTSALFIHSARLAPAATRGNSADFKKFPPPQLVQNTAASAAAAQREEDLLLTEKLRAACMQSFLRNGGGGGGGGGPLFMAEQGQGMNFSQEPDTWFNFNADGMLTAAELS